MLCYSSAPHPHQSMLRVYVGSGSSPLLAFKEPLGLNPSKWLANIIVKLDNRETSAQSLASRGVIVLLENSISYGNITIFRTEWPEASARLFFMKKSTTITVSDLIRICYVKILLAKSTSESFNQRCSKH
jgi:hypothetical protein